MQRATLGFRMHSGWGVLVAVAGQPASLEVIDRRRIVIIDPETQGAKQPYHYAEHFDIAKAEKHIAGCAAASERLAMIALEETVQNLDARHYQVEGAALLLASGRPLPSLEKILAAHPLIHTAEGEFFRNVMRTACQTLNIPITAMSERELGGLAISAFGKAATEVQHRIEAMPIGPPWTRDHKAAALAAAMVLSRQS